MGEFCVYGVEFVTSRMFNFMIKGLAMSDLCVYVVVSMCDFC